MATYEQLMDAARRADKAGDAQAARRFLELAAGSSQKQSGENVIATKEGGGRFIKGSNGAVSFASPGYSTSDPETVERLMRGEDVQSVVQSGFDQQVINQHPVAARAAKVIEGVPFVGSYVDEAAGAFSKGLEAVGIGEGEAQQGVRAVSSAMDREKPGQSMGLQAAGTVAGAVPMAMAAVPSIASAAPASRLGRAGYGLLAGATAGGTEGAIYGAGQGETQDERVSNAQTQAGIGAGLGGLLGGLGPFAADAMDAGLKALKQSDTSQIMRRFGLSKPAARVIKQHVDAGDIAGARRALMQGGDDAMLGEATQGSRSLLDAVAAKGGRPESVVNEAIEGRVARGNAAFRAAADDAMGTPPQGVSTAADEIAARTGPQRRAAYDAAYNTPINYAANEGRAVEDVLGRIPPRTLKSAIDDANEEMLSQGLRNQQIMAQVADDGSVAFREMPNVRQLDELKKSLDRLAKRDEFGRIAPEGLRPARLAQEVRNAAVEATGGQDGPYAQALRVGGDKIAEDQALKMGSNLLRDSVTRDDVIRMMTGASQDARNSAKVGFRNSINELMDNVRTVASDRNVDAREVKRAVDRLSSKAMRDKARIVLGADEADTFFQEVDRVTSGLNLRAAVSENSRTARRQAVQGTIQDASAPNAIQSAAGGEPISSVKQVVQFLTGETADARAFREEGVAEEIARFLTTTKGKSADAALNYINKAMAGQALTDAQAKYVANVLATTGFLTGGREGQRRLTPPR